jgi:hypothetical protein
MIRSEETYAIGANDPCRDLPTLAQAHVRLAAVPARREPRLRHAPDGARRPQAPLRIYSKVIAEQRRRGPGALLVGVLDGARWSEAQPQAPSRTDETLGVSVG